MGVWGMLLSCKVWDHIRPKVFSWFSVDFKQFWSIAPHGFLTGLGSSGSQPVMESWTYFHDGFSSQTQKGSLEATMWFLAPIPKKISWEYSEFFLFYVFPLKILEHKMTNKVNWQQTPQSERRHMAGNLASIRG